MYNIINTFSDSDYYSYGSIMPGRYFSSGTGYAYGFNGKENDNEVKGVGNSLDFGARIYDSRLGRFLSVDPDANIYPFMSSYCFAANSPITLIDLLGYGPECANCPSNENIHNAPVLNEAGLKATGKQFFDVGADWAEKSKETDFIYVPSKLSIYYYKIFWNPEFDVNGTKGHYMAVRYLIRSTDQVMHLPKLEPTFNTSPEIPLTLEKLPEMNLPTPTKKVDNTPVAEITPIINPNGIPSRRRNDVPKDRPIPQVPNPGDLCWTCFMGKSALHWNKGINSIVNFLTNNPDFNLKITADGGSSSIIKDTWNDKALFARETYAQVVNNRFNILKEAVVKAGGDAGRIIPNKGNVDGSKLDYEAVRK